MNIIDSVWHYIDKYYLSGIINDTVYNPVDTITYALFLGVSLFGVLKLLERMKVKIDPVFMLSVAPYIIAGSSLRVLEDSKVFTAPLKYLFVTPIIYFFMFAVTITILAIAIKLERKGMIRDHNRFFCYAGVLWAFINIIALVLIDGIRNPIPATVILILGISVTGIVYLISRQINFLPLTNKLNIFILFTHLLDASSTFIGIDWLNYYEKHVAPTFFINLASNYTDHPAIVMFPLKLLVFIPVLYILDTKFVTEEEKKLIGIMKLAILVLGLSPATRNTLRILMGV